MRGLKDKVAVVAGAAPGSIGGATAVRLAEEGMTVVVADLNETAAQKVAAEIRATGGEATARQFDITNEDSYASLIDFAVRTYGRLDGLYNVAADLSPATMSADVDVTSVPLDLWQRTIDITLTGYMLGIRHALPIMLRQGSGSIVNTMSSSIWVGETTKVAYQAPRAASWGSRDTRRVSGESRGCAATCFPPASPSRPRPWRRPPRNGGARPWPPYVPHVSASRRTWPRWWRSSSRTTLPSSMASRSSSTAARTSTDVRAR
ncbi:SDR family NAD(P)-dependent oxidoreductase [Streptomyces sp. 4503]|uniref:SDR family NAD(P)-dependent oxidoreductase n=1 Tax=Streptomyces niphimycinicus TaxID=2842201 RepID=A0ABS6CJ12_9ACTN|nr:SDR family NAD(P)-dependent oxidoreductase [Streptomyces niphimycinicus]MBU3866919.1 SDR family NAD(P)-dependent oxidoreductase [Streptomyces niphimycinicus]